MERTLSLLENKLILLHMCCWNRGGKKCFLSTCTCVLTYSILECAWKNPNNTYISSNFLNTYSHNVPIYLSLIFQIFVIFFFFFSMFCECIVNCQCISWLQLLHVISSSDWLLASFEISPKAWMLSVLYLKSGFTFGKCQRPVSSLSVSKHMHTITNL